MYDELDIFEKECSNDQFRFECMIECMIMDASMTDGYTTEAEGIAAKIMNKVKSIFEKISNAVKSMLDKISNFFTTKKLKAKYEELLEEAKRVEAELKKTHADNEKVAKVLEKYKFESYDLAKEMGEVKRISDYVIAGAKSVASKIKGGEKVTSDDILKIRQDAHDKWQHTGYVANDEKREYKKAKRVADIVSFLSSGGIVGSLVAAITKLKGGSVKDTICIGGAAAAITGIVEGIAHLSPQSPVASGIHKMRGDRHDAARNSALSANRHYETASQYNDAVVMAQATAIASLTTVIQEAETMSYRQGVKCLTKTMNEIHRALANVENACVDEQNYEANMGNLDFDHAKGLKSLDH